MVSTDTLSVALENIYTVKHSKAHVSSTRRSRSSHRDSMHHPADALLLRSGTDSHRPAKRPRSMSSSSTQRTGAVCGACAKSESRNICDGKSRCNECDRFRRPWCVYYLCNMRTCDGSQCSLLHAHQWSTDEEGEQRLIAGVNHSRR